MWALSHNAVLTSLDAGGVEYLNAPNDWTIFMMSIPISTEVSPILVTMSLRLCLKKRMVS
jgi:hypothetical protein